MPTVNAGSVASIHCPLDSTITVTPGATAKVSVQSVSSPSFLAATITDAKTLPVTAGDLVIITAIDADVTYTDPALSAAQVAAVVRNPANSGEGPQRVFLLGDSLTLRNSHYFSGARTEVNATDIEIALGTGAELPVIGSYVRVMNQSNDLLNGDWPVVGSGTNSTVIRYPFTITGLSSATMTGATYGVGGDCGWWNFAEGELAALGRPCQVVRNASDGGDTLVQIRARIATEIAPYAQPGDIVAFMGGVNGAGTGADDSLDESTSADVVAQLALIFDELLALDVTVLASTITQAQASAYWATSPATALANTVAANGYIRGRALSHARLLCFDSHAALGAGDYAASDVEANGIHFLPSGAEKIGQRLVDDCVGAFRKGTFRRVLSVSDAYVDSASWNLLTNVEFAGATGATKPYDWSVLSAGGGTKTYTLSARSDGLGNDLEIAHSHTAATGTQLAQDITARVSAGDRLVFGIEYESGTLAEGHYWRLIMEFDVGGVTYSHALSVNDYSYASGGRLPPGGVRRLFEWYGDSNGGRIGCLVPTAFTAARLVLRWQLGEIGRAHV